MSQKHDVQTPNYKIIQTPFEGSKKSRGGGELIFIKKNFSYKIRKDLSESDEHKKLRSLEVSYKNPSNILLSWSFKPPKSDK